MRVNIELYQKSEKILTQGKEKTKWLSMDILEVENREG